MQISLLYYRPIPTTWSQLWVNWHERPMTPFKRRLYQKISSITVKSFLQFLKIQMLMIFDTVMIGVWNFSRHIVMILSTYCTMPRLTSKMIKFKPTMMDDAVYSCDAGGVHHCWPILNKGFSFPFKTFTFWIILFFKNNKK